MRLSALSVPSLAAALVMALPAGAQELPVSFTGSVAVVSDYTFRGISQTLEDPAIQGGITGAGGPVYLGVWGSSLNFGETDHEHRAHTEIDIFGGVKLPLGVADADLGFTYYAYPGTSDAFEYDFLEFALGLSKAISSATLGVKTAYSPDFFLSSGSGLYIGGSLGVALPGTPFSLAGTVGKQSIDENGTFGVPDYMDYSVGASVSVLGVGLGASIVGTDIEEEQCFGGAAPFSGTCGTRAVLSVSRALYHRLQSGTREPRAASAARASFVQ
jgi:uncharacterized protein (TIGR02001 family)